MRDGPEGCPEQSGLCDDEDAPGVVTQAQLDELHIQVTEVEEP